MAQTKDTTRVELLRLLNERRELFEVYSKSLQQKSGLFGNRTKNDLRKSQDYLLEIVDLDNKVMNSLNRVISLKNFEKTTMTYDAGANDERISNLVKVNDALTKENERLLNESKNYNHKINQSLLLDFLFLLLAIGVIYYSRRVKKDKQ